MHLLLLSLSLPLSLPIPSNHLGSCLGHKQRSAHVMFLLQIMGTVTVVNACAGKAGLASTATVQPAGTPVHLRTECCAVDVGTASAASVSAGTLEPQDPPANAVPPVATLVTLSGNVSTLFSSGARFPQKFK